MMRNRIRLFWSMVPAILSLAWPTMLEELMQTAVQYIDTAMVGSLGTQATAAVGATTTVSWLIGSTISALGVGFLAYISQACGIGDHKRVRIASAQAVLIVLVVGSLFTVITTSLSQLVPVWMQVDPQLCSMSATYFLILYSPMLPRTAMIIFGTILRAVGDSKTPMRIGIWVNLINIVLNIFLIFPSGRVFGLLIPGAGLGVAGAALASAAAYTVGGIAITVSLWKHPVLSPCGVALRLDWSVLKPCLKVALPNAFQRFGTSLGYVAFAAMINSLGEIATAAHTIANTVESAFYIPGYGMQTAAATLSGNAYGAGDRQRMKELSATIIVLEILFMAVSETLLFAFAPDMMRIFSADLQVITLGAVVLRMVAVSEPFYGVSIVIEGMLQGMGKTFVPLVCNIIGMWGIRIVGTYICTVFMGMGLVSAWSCMIAHNLFLFVMFVLYYLSGKWNATEK